jgi:hypothetical protein
MMAEEACINRFKKGLKKCEGCAKGKKLLEEKLAELKEENEQYGILNPGN